MAVDPKETEKRMNVVIAHVRWMHANDLMPEDYTDKAADDLVEAMGKLINLRFEFTKNYPVARGVRS